MKVKKKDAFCLTFLKLALLHKFSKRIRKLGSRFTATQALEQAMEKPGRARCAAGWLPEAGARRRRKHSGPGWEASGWQHSATARKSLQSWMKNLLAVLRYPTWKPGLGGNAILCTPAYRTQEVLWVKPTGIINFCSHCAFCLQSLKWFANVFRDGEKEVQSSERSCPTSHNHLQ